MRGDRRALRDHASEVDGDTCQDAGDERHGIADVQSLHQGYLDRDCAPCHQKCADNRHSRGTPYIGDRDLKNSPGKK